MEQEYYVSLILKELTEGLTAPERDTLARWLESAEHRQLYQEIRANWQSEPEATSSEAEAAYERLEQQLDFLLAPAPKEAPVKALPRRRWMAVAASLVAGLFLSFLAYHLLRTPTVTIRTGYGEVSTHTLPDGSRVHLNANSSLRYARNWDTQTTRKVSLTGEAFFQVEKKRAGTKFIVRTEQLAIAVLGTAFNVNTRRQKTQVVLESGKVQLTSAQEELLMQPGDWVEYAEASFSKKTVIPEAYTAWKDRKLVLDHTSVREIARLIEEQYGRSVVVEDAKLRDKKLSGSIPTHNFDVFLEILSETVNAPIVQEDNRVVIKKIPTDF